MDMKQGAEIGGHLLLDLPKAAHLRALEVLTQVLNLPPNLRSRTLPLALNIIETYLEQETRPQFVVARGDATDDTTVDLGPLLREAQVRRGAPETFSEAAIFGAAGIDPSAIDWSEAELHRAPREPGERHYRGEPTPGSRVSADVPPPDKATGIPFVDHYDAAVALPDIAAVLDICRQEGLPVGVQVLSKERVIAWTGDLQRDLDRFRRENGGAPHFWLYWDEIPAPTQGPLSVFRDCRGPNALAQAATWLLESLELRS